MEIRVGLISLEWGTTDILDVGLLDASLRMSFAEVVIPMDWATEIADLRREVGWGWLQPTGQLKDGSAVRTKCISSPLAARIALKFTWR